MTFSARTASGRAGDQGKINAGAIRASIAQARQIKAKGDHGE